MEFHFIRLKPTGGLVTAVDPKSKPRYMCFKNRLTADLCVKHFAQFKSKHGRWPQLDLSHSTVEIKSAPEFEMATVDQIEDMMVIDTMSWEDVMCIGRISNISLFYCHSFGVIPDGNTTDITFSAQEVDLEVDPQLYIMNLEFNEGQG